MSCVASLGLTATRWPVLEAIPESGREGSLVRPACGLRRTLLQGSLPTRAPLTPCALSPGADARVILPKKEKLKLRRERWLQSKYLPRLPA